MDKNTILKIAGLLIGPVLIMTVGLYFLYPVLNEEKYREVSEKYAGANPADVSATTIGEEAIDSLSVSSGMAVTGEGKSNKQITPEDSLRIENRRLKFTSDSLRTVNEELKRRMKERSKIIEDSLKTAMAASEEQDLDLSQRIKSLLNLDEEELAPIVNELTDSQLVLLYERSGTMQRRKLLRSLKPARAAKLMTEIML